MSLLTGCRKPFTFQGNADQLVFVRNIGSQFCIYSCHLSALEFCTQNFVCVRNSLHGRQLTLRQKCPTNRRLSTGAKKPAPKNRRMLVLKQRTTEKHRNANSNIATMTYSWLLIALLLALQTISHSVTDALPTHRRLSDLTTSNFYCTPAQAERNAELFKEHWSSKFRWTSCPSHHWLVRYAQLSTAGPEIILDVGCNKGYESMNFFALFAPRANANPPNAYNIHLNSSYGIVVFLSIHFCSHIQSTDHWTLKTDRAQTLCGNCKDCEHTLGAGHTIPQESRGVRVYCFEPSFTHFSALMTLRKSMDHQLRAQQASWHLVNVAVGASVNLVRFPRACEHEECAVATDNSHQVKVCLRFSLVFCVHTTCKTECRRALDTKLQS